MTFIRHIPAPGENSSYVYRVKSYREKGTGKVKQKTEFLGKEIVKSGKKVIIPPKHKRTKVKRVLSCGGPVVLYHLAEKLGLPHIIDNAVEGCTGIPDTGKKITVLAINKVLSNDGIEGIKRWFCSTSLKRYTGLSANDFTPKKVRGLNTVLSIENPDIIGAIERGIVNKIKKKYPEDLSMLIYDLTELTFYGTVNTLAKYGHAYRQNGNEMQINLVLAITKKRKLPVHHRMLPGNIVSVSTIRRFAHELKEYGIKNIVVVMDRGFYSEKNMEEMKDYKIIGAVSPNLKIYKKAVKKSTEIEHPKNYTRYNKEVFFVMKHEINGKQLIVLHSPLKHAKDLEKYYAEIYEREQYLKERENILYGSEDDMLKELETVCKPHNECFKIDPKKTKNGWGFSYRLLHNTILEKSKRLGKTVLFTTTSLPSQDILRLYREKDVVEKVFCLMKRRGLTPINATKEETTRAYGMSAVLGYSLLASLRNVLGDVNDECDNGEKKWKKEENRKKGKMEDEKTLSLEKALSLLDEIKEVVFSDDSTTLTDITKEQERLLEKVGVVLR